jgi:hypothetical protein
MSLQLARQSLEAKGRDLQLAAQSLSCDINSRVSAQQLSSALGRYIEEQARCLSAIEAQIQTLAAQIKG